MGFLTDMKSGKSMKNVFSLFFAALWLWSLSLPVQAVEHLKLSTTTSTDNTGLIAVLNSVFEVMYDVKVEVIAAGTGKALKIGSRGDVDVVFVHAPRAELEYVKQGHFINRQEVMHNDFVIIGPSSDPANLSGARSAVDALRRLMNAQARFVSRGDDSGTHKKELALWKAAEMSPYKSLCFIWKRCWWKAEDVSHTGSWYIQAGQGMGAVIKMADELHAYTLTDRGTYLAYIDKMELKVLYEGDAVLFNPYHIMAVNPERHVHVNYDLAMQYIQFVTSEQGQSIIRDFKMLGEPLFYPDVIK
jgi:tungstate transport system substrate-binding protein